MICCTGFAIPYHVIVEYLIHDKINVLGIVLDYKSNNYVIRDAA